MNPARLLCGLVGMALVVLLGLPVVSAVLRGVAPYDLTGLTLATLPERFEETAGLLLLALGLVAIGAATTGKGWAWTGLAALLAALIIWAGVVHDSPSTMVVAMVRLAVMGATPILVTVLVAMATKSPAGQTGAAT